MKLLELDDKAVSGPRPVRLVRQDNSGSGKQRLVRQDNSGPGKQNVEEQGSTAQPWYTYLYFLVRLYLIYMVTSSYMVLYVWEFQGGVYKSGWCSSTRD